MVSAAAGPGDSVVTLTLSEAPLDWADLDLGAFNVGLTPTDGIITSAGAVAVLSVDDVVTVGEGWSLTAPTGLSFSGGGDVTPATGSLS